MAIPSARNVLDGFEDQRKQVLAQPWNRGIDVAEVAEYLANLSDSRVASIQYQSDHPYPLLQPRGGFPTLDKQKALSEALADAGADFIPLTIDSHTRHNEYDLANQLLVRGEREAKDYLNGFPLVCQGHEATRKIYDNVDKPICLRHGTPDARLLVETAIASGLTEIEGGALCYSIPYSEGFPIDRAILYWQYVDRVCAEYSTPERPIHRESFGPLSATMVPPVMTVVVQLIELLLAAEQGIKSFSVSFGQTGSFSQDMALGHILKSKAREYLSRFGFDDVNVYLAYHQWMGAFPMDKDRAGDLIAMSSVMARLVRADKIIVKTREEAFGIPAIETNCEAIRGVRYVFEKLPIMDQITSVSIAEESKLLASEVDNVMDAILNMPGDVFWESVYQAVRTGLIDIPFSPHRMNKNDMLTVRDEHQAIRIMEPGMVPLRTEDIAHERELINGRVSEHANFVDKMIEDIHIMN